MKQPQTYELCKKCAHYGYGCAGMILTEDSPPEFLLCNATPTCFEYDKEE